MDLSGYALTTLRQDSDFALYRASATQSPTRYPASVLVSMLASDSPRPECVRMLESELVLRTELDSRWAVRPLAMAQYQGRPALILEDPQGEPLDRLLDTAPLLFAPGAHRSAEVAADLRLFLRLAVGLAGSLAEVHRRGIIHKNIRP